MELVDYLFARGRFILLHVDLASQGQGLQLRVDNHAIQSVTFRPSIHDGEDFVELLLILVADLACLVLPSINHALAQVCTILRLRLIDITLHLDQSID